MERKKSQKIYKIFMLMILTATITYMITSITIYSKIDSAQTNFVNQTEAGTTKQSSTVNFNELRALLSEKYMGDINDEKMYEGAIKGYVEGLGDPYTTYLTKEEMKELTEETSGKYVGIGVYVTNNTTDDTIVVVGVMKGSPAQEAGMQAGDIIRKVDGITYQGSQLSEATAILKGEENTEVAVTVIRENEEIDMKITRRKITIEHVASKMLDDQIGYIQIDSFDEGVADEFEKQYLALKESNIRGLIIDLRNNGGGVVDEATALADLFTEKNLPVLITKNKSGNEEVTKAKREKIIKDIPVVVLINQATASASEILAGALRDNYEATIVGKKSYGKGVIQTVYRLSNGAGLKITTNEYFTPNYKVIHEKGIEPDEEVELSRNEDGYYETSEEKDTQLNKAKEVLKHKLSLTE